MSYTAATVEGYVTHTPIVRKTKTGKSLCMFSLAIRHFSQPDVEPKVSFMDVETWEKLADTCSERVDKGKRVLVIGTLRQDRWEGKDGKLQSKIKLVGNKVRFLETGITQKEDSAKEMD
ncbi:MAG TPA: single-stranded DNA-binding protein [Spirochaetota bacterium]